MASSGTVLQRVIFPVHGDPQALPLYLDIDTWSAIEKSDDELERYARARGFASEERNRQALRLTNRNGLALLSGRRGLKVPAYEHVSLGTYFNAFPASYWNTWTSLTGVSLRVHTRGVGTVIVYRSNARGVIQRVTGAEVEGELLSTFEIPFNSFIDGGWLWFDLYASDDDFALESADWCVPDGAEPVREGRASVSITTLNRGAYCTALLGNIGDDKEVLSLLDRVTVVDQGSERIADDPGYSSAAERLEGKLNLIEQANLGGSGGFARGMLETVEAGDSDYVILLDDDVEIEPESLRRVISFANFSTHPTIVGGHMFDMYDKPKLHAFAEGIRWKPFMWGPFTPDRHDFASSNLRQTRWLHRRYDVDYNGWWMSLIPVSVVKEIGLALPVFIKWDDAEYSLRAREHGVPTVSLPGAAVWHVSWVDKDDTHDWQAFFHARNRLIAALLHSPYPSGGLLARSNFAQDLKNLLTMDYYTVALRHEAIKNVFAGPQQLHRDMRDRLARVRKMAANYRETTVIRDTDQIGHFPAREITSVTTGTIEVGPRGPSMVIWMLRQVFRHAFTSPAPDSATRPSALLPYQDARWFRVPGYDSVLITNADGSGVTWHVREPRTFRRMLAASIRLNLRYRREWQRLSEQYKAALPEITSTARWHQTFGIESASEASSRSRKNAAAQKRVAKTT